MLVSVVIPVYNNEECIGRCLDSIMRQTYSNLEIIVVNDGSVDNTINVLNEYVRKDPRIVIIDQTNTGIRLARAKGINLSNGAAILNVDSDDYLELEAIELLVKVMISEDADIVVADHNTIGDGSIKQVRNQIPSECNKISILRYFLLGKITGYVWGKLYKRFLLENIRIPTNERVITEDILTNLFVLCNYEIKISLIDRPLFNYTVNNNIVSYSREKKNIESFFEEIYLVEKMLKEVKEHGKLESELAAFKCRTWVIYCRFGGAHSKEKQYHTNFYNSNYELAKNHLPFYQRIEMYLYAKNLSLGNMVTKYMLWTKKYLLS